MKGVYFLGKERAIAAAVNSEEMKRLLTAFYRGAISEKHLVIALTGLLTKMTPENSGDGNG